MHERELWWKISLVGGLLTLAVSAIIPVDQRIKFGIDLRGGYSLMYEIDDTGLDETQKRTLSEQVMKILKERVDPNGVLNLVWRPVGHNRLEIQMPRPPEQVAQKRDQFVQLRDELLKHNIRRGDVLLALTRASAERNQAFERLTHGVPQRKKLLDDLAAAYDQRKAAESSDDETARENAEKAYQAAMTALMATNIESSRLEIALNADPRRSFRKEELGKIKAEHPALAEPIQATINAFDDWHRERGKGGSLDDPADLQRLLRGAGVLEFRLLATSDPSNPHQYDHYIEGLEKRGPRRMPEDNLGWFPIDDPVYFFHGQLRGGAKDLETEFPRIKHSFYITEKYGDKYYVLAHLEDNMSLAQNPQGGADWQLKAAVPTRDQEGRPAVSFTLDEKGGSRFQRLTSQNIGKQLCFFLDGQAVSSATIQSAIRTNGIITGNFSVDEVQRMCQKLNAGSLPRKLKEPPISIQGIGPSLGEENRHRGQQAALYGCLAVALFMIVYYRYSGLIAVIAVALNLLLTGAVLASLGATLNLAGIAGMVLAVGMAVDANVLINERIHEELRGGSGMRMAIKLGYERAFNAILDSNVTTILTCLILYWMGSEEIKGFALTLGWGVVISLATAVYVTRFFFEYMELARLPREVKRYPLLLALGCAAAGGLFWGLGYLTTSREAVNESISVFFGRLLVGMLPATLIVLGLMAIMRWRHRAVQARTPNTLPMLQLIGVPRIDWYSKRRLFYAVSLVTTLGGAALFFGRPAKDLYDIEFLGGTAVTIDLKPDLVGKIGQKEITERLEAARVEMKALADKLASAQVSRKGSDFVVAATGVPSERLANMVAAQISDEVVQGGITESGPNEVTVRLKDEARFGDAAPSVEIMQQQLKLAAARARRAGDEIADSQVQTITSVGGNVERGSSFEIVTRETSRELVVDAIKSKLRDDLDMQPKLDFHLRTDPSHGDAAYFPVTDEDLGKVLNDSTVTERVPEAVGGVVIVADELSPPQPLESLRKRLRDMRLQPSKANLGWRQQSVIGLTPAGTADGKQTFSRVAILTTDENYIYEEGGPLTAQWRQDMAEPEVQLAQEALERETSLGKVSQFAPQVAQEAKTQAYIAIVLSWLMIVVYLWFRFGSVTWGLAAVLALVHDALVAIGFVAAAYYIAKVPGLGGWPGLMVEPFRIDMSIVAALLTVIGYSVNDTIVVFDRIRENRGKLKSVTPSLINQSINQTMSRTLLTVTTVLLTIVIMYFLGGRGIHGFNYAMLIGVLTGCYSSIFVASPLLIALRNRKEAAMSA